MNLNSSVYIARVQRGLDDASGEHTGNVSSVVSRVADVEVCQRVAVDQVKLQIRGANTL